LSSVIEELSNAKPAGKTPVIGLAGGIGAGKSAVARVLESLGAAVLDSDRQVHALYRDPEVVRTVCQWWGESVLGTDGAVDRGAVASIVFQNPGELDRLEGLLYPRMARWREDRIAELSADPGVSAIVLDTPKLYETGLDGLCDAVIFVAADRAVREARVIAGRGWTGRQLEQRENLLKPLDQKQASADYVVENQADLAALQAEIRRIYSSILEARSKGDSSPSAS
jgi:dephospho-CoA kinase